MCFLQGGVSRLLGFHDGTCERTIYTVYTNFSFQYSMQTLGSKWTARLNNTSSFNPNVNKQTMKVLKYWAAAASSHPKGTFHIPTATMPGFLHSSKFLELPSATVQRSTRNKHILTKHGGRDFSRNSRGRNNILPECSRQLLDRRSYLMR